MKSGGGGLLTGLAAILLTAAPAFGQDGSLEWAVMRGIERHPEVRVAQAEVSQAQLQLQMVRNAYLPTVSAATGPAAAGLGYEVSVSQPLYDWGQAGGLGDQRRALLAAEEASLAIARDDVALQVVEAYLDVVQARTQLTYLDEHLQRLQDLADMTAARVEGRYADQSEAGRVNLAVAAAEGTRARISGDLAEAVGRYELMVEAPAEGLRLPANLPVFLDTVADEAALDVAIAASPLYRRASLAISAADAGIRQAKAARLPRLLLEGGTQRREIGGGLVSDSSLAVRLRFSSQGMEALQRPEIERRRREAAVWAAEGEARELKTLVGRLVRSDAALARRIDAMADQIAQGEAVRALYEEQFLVGRRDIQDLVMMETEGFEARRQKVEWVIERQRLQYRAAAQLGRLTQAMAGDELQAVAVQP